MYNKRITRQTEACWGERAKTEMAPNGCHNNAATALGYSHFITMHAAVVAGAEFVQRIFHV